MGKMQVQELSLSLQNSCDSWAWQRASVILASLQAGGKWRLQNPGILQASQPEGHSSGHQRDPVLNTEEGCSSALSLSFSLPLLSSFPLLHLRHIHSQDYSRVIITVIWEVIKGNLPLLQCLSVRLDIFHILRTSCLSSLSVKMLRESSSLH